MECPICFKETERLVPLPLDYPEVSETEYACADCATLALLPAKNLAPRDEQSAVEPAVLATIGGGLLGLGLYALLKALKED